MAGGLSSSDNAFYRDLLGIVADETRNGLIVKYANLQYARCMSVLRHEKDSAEIYRAQGEASAWEKVANIHRDVLNILKSAK